MLARFFVIAVSSFLTTALSGCPVDECPPGTRLIDERCVAGGEGEGEGEGQDAGPDDTCEARTVYRDDDGDGWGSEESTETCEVEDGWVEAPGDCDDAVRTTHPEAPELCNSVDDDCVDGVDEDVEYVTWFRDTDADTWGDDADTTVDCRPPDGFVERGGDCATADPLVHPDAEEVCNEIDDDCANGPDDGLEIPVWYRDADGDDHGNPADVAAACARPEGFAEAGDDCDDGAAAVHPGATEVCNAVDDDCANGADDEFECVLGSVQTCTTSCGTTGTTTCGAACTPEACVPPAEVCNYVDDDCDGLVDPGQQAFLGDAVRMTAAQGTNIWEPRIAWGGESYAVAWNDAQNIVVTVRDAALAELEAPSNIVTDNANVMAMDLTFSGSIWVAGHDAGGGGGTRRYELTEVGDDLGFIDDWQSSAGAGISISKIDAAPVAGGAVTLFQTGGGSIRARGIVSDAPSFHTGATIDGTNPDAAASATGDVLVAYTSNGELGVALLDQDGDESIGHRLVTNIGLVGRVAIAQARADVIVSVFETSNGTGPVRSVLLDDDLDTLGDPVEIAAEGKIVPDAIASNGAELLVTYAIGNDAWLVRLDLSGSENGTAVEIPLILQVGNGPAPSVVWAGTAWALVYVDDADGNASSGWDVYARRYGCP